MVAQQNRSAAVCCAACCAISPDIWRERIQCLRSSVRSNGAARCCGLLRKRKKVAKKEKSTLSPEYYVLRPSQPAEGDGYRESTFCGYVVRPAGSRFRDRRADPSTKTRVFCPGAARPRRTPAESEIHMPRSIQADHTTIATCPICGTNAPVLEDRAAGLLERWRREHAEHDEAERRDFAKEPG